MLNQLRLVITSKHVLRMERSPSVLTIEMQLAGVLYADWLVSRATLIAVNARDI
jgi:hypothetical protein